MTHLPGSDPTGGRPVVPSRGALRPLGLDEVRITGGFWAERQRVNATVTLDHGRSWMDKLGWTGNFTADPDRTPDRRGREFTDSEVYKLMEAMAWETGRTGDEARDAELSGLTATIATAQAPDGYLHTAFGRPGQPPRYSDPAFGHELYCTGHLLQAAVARARTRGEDELTAIARRAADHVCDAFGPGDGGMPGLCGHPEIEMALAELARVTGEERYLEQAALFVERRGHRWLPEHHLGWSYFQDDVPVREASVLRGHAVRALYLSSGAVDVAVETGDDELLEAVAAQFTRTLARRTYLTGGMGSRHLDEAFGDDYVLPADRAYSETCAGVAAAMLSWRLLLATGEDRYADLVERVLYNVIAASIGDDGRSFFYANTLHQRVPTEELNPERELLRFDGGPRAPWFEVSCCLGNIARTFASLAGYLATADAEGLRIHQYANAEVSTRLDDGRRVGLAMRTGYPDDGTVAVRVTETDGGPWALTLRVPPWATGARLAGPEGREEPVAAGTNATVRRVFAIGDEIRLRLPMRPRWTRPDPRIDAARGCVAAERGPIVLCAEALGTDPEELNAVTVDASADPEETPDGLMARAARRGTTSRAADDGALAPEADGWPYAPASEAPGPSGEDFALPLIPYHRWGRRGPSTMRVWLPES
jgi:DUF1680 family protein